MFKFLMKKFISHKLILQGLGTYLLIVTVLTCFIVPIYLQSYGAVKDGIILDAQRNVEKGIKLLQNEIDTYYSIIDTLSSNKMYKHIRDLKAPISVENYFYINNFQNYYKDLLLSATIQENSFIVFSENDIILSKYTAFDNAQNFYGNIWEYSGLTYDQMKSFFLLDNTREKFYLL